MSSRSILLVSFFTFLILIGLISYSGSVRYLTHTFKIPQNCKATTETNLICSDFHVYWHYTKRNSQAALVKQFTNTILYNRSSVVVDTLQYDIKNPGLSTLIFSRDSLITATLSFGEVENEYVVIVFEPRRPIQSLEQLPEFVKNLLRLS